MSEAKSRPRWDESDEGVSHVKAFLQRSGFPLELKAAQIAEQFVHSIGSEVARTTARAPLYFRDRKGVPRELDGIIGLSEKFSLEHVTFHVDFQVLVECKHRENVEWFAFDVHRQAGTWYTNLIPPIVSNAALVPLFSRYAQEREHLQLPEYRLTALEFVKGDPRVFSEPLCMEVAAATHDYLAALTGRAKRTYPFTAPVALQSLNLPHRFSHFRGESRAPLASEIMRFVDTLTTEDHNRYLGAIAGSAPQVVSLLFVIPILCVNGPLRVAKVSHDGTVERFEASQFAATRLHLEQWPGEHIVRILGPSSGFPLLVTGIDTFRATLDYVLGMYKATSYTLRQLLGNPLLATVPLNVAVSNFLLDHDASRQ